MTLEEKIQLVEELKTTRDAKLEEKTKLEVELGEITTQLDTLLNEILVEMKKRQTVELHTNGLVAQYFAKSEFSYGDEKALLDYLIAHDMNKYVTTKTTQSLNKKDLKKDLKENASLKESLSKFVGDRKTEYVVVNTEELHQRMLEHIEEGKKK